MKLILIVGSGAVGKMTVGQSIMKLNKKLRLFHNHMMIEPVLQIFGTRNGSVIQKLRQIIFEEFLKTDNEGLIFTFMWAFDSKSDWDYVNNLSNLFDEFYCIELIAPQEIRLQRNATENRLNNKASKRDLNFSNQNLINEDKKYRLVSNEGEINFKNYMRIDNSNLSPDEVAKKIIDKFNLGYSSE